MTRRPLIDPNASEHTTVYFAITTPARSELQRRPHQRRRLVVDAKDRGRVSFRIVKKVAVAVMFNYRLWPKYSGSRTSAFQTKS
jgi:hypothetical protein